MLVGLYLCSQNVTNWMLLRISHAWIIYLWSSWVLHKLDGGRIMVCVVENCVQSKTNFCKSVQQLITPILCSSQVSDRMSAWLLVFSCLYVCVCFWGFVVVQEAIATGDPEIVQLCLQHRDSQRYNQRSQGIPGLLQRLTEVCLPSLLLLPCNHLYSMLTFSLKLLETLCSKLWRVLVYWIVK